MATSISDFAKASDLFGIYKFEEIEEYFIHHAISLEEDCSPLPHAYSWKRDFASQISHGMYGVE